MNRPPTPQPAAVVEQALATLAPRWTAWIVQTLHQHGPLKLALLSKQLPFVTYGSLNFRVSAMTESGLLRRRTRAYPIVLSPAAAALPPLHAALADWSRRHTLLDGTTVADAERVEDALQRLRHRHLLPTIGWIADHPGTTPAQLAENLNIPYSSAAYRLDRLVTDGLLRGTGRTPSNRGSVVLTAAGQEAPALLAHLGAWAEGAALPASGRTARHSSRAAAAVRRSTAPLAPAFSHAETARPWSPPPAAPARGR